MTDWARLRLYGNEKQKQILSPWPLAEPRPYREWLNQSQGKEEVENLRDAVKKCRPYGSEKWVAKTVAQFGLGNTMRNPGRPKKGS
jgi:hypothetical protein